MLIDVPQELVVLLLIFLRENFKLWEDSKMTDVVYREARLDDIPAMSDVFLASLSDMYARFSITEAPPPRPTLVPVYKHVLSTGIFRVAEVESQIVVIASAIIRDRIWFLSTFWARPDQQRKGIGMPLLKGLWDTGKAAGATTFFTHSSPDMTAMAAYMKMGMLPGHQIIYFRGQPQQLPAVPSGYEAVPLEKAVAMQLDQQIRGTGREPDHEFWLGAGVSQGRQVLHHGKVVGYYYTGRSGIGPAAWTATSDAGGVMALAWREATSAAPEIRFAVPGVNHAALRMALDAKLKIVSVFHFLTTAPIGQMERYLPSGPALY